MSPCDAPAVEKRRLEAKVCDLVRRIVVDHGDVEDDETECKSDWPTDMAKTARQIAGLANAARGRDVLWLIGLDEKKGIVAPVEQTELSSWWPKVSAEFDCVAPDLQSMWVKTEHGDVMALLFSTDRSPYVIKVKPGSSSVHKEVPWRGANGTNTAKREQLLSLLVDTVSVPEIELSDPVLALVGSTLEFTATLDIIAAPPTHRPPLLPRRLWTVRVESETEWAVGRHVLLDVSINRHILTPAERFIDSATSTMQTRPATLDPESPYGVYVRTVGLIVTGSDSLTIQASADAGDLAIHCDGAHMSVIVEMPIERTDRVARARCDLRFIKLDDEDPRTRAWTRNH